ncbi:MAG: hypothetical protein AUJ11_02660 [Parcubacteria group bacterium CG1_02_44_65]|uniref:Cell division protein FtsL n=2 Tax=Candidatus Portnoyibacteriota TaxID=1817913 RepID=A0A2M7YMH2_9BACT|nr:MAG: hypothetical protein AUJ11_02660 [Parcubacteria group bacterium CG1_02_44_65]PIP15664.1 MAG: hypothetical protein COX45_01575 [Candidatus Portnoybacteria bacterium CG23_combo_of_CG06-09_8_20_14_all_44_36]PJA64160.1 MAG: hypothetical protein CO160_00075 [Candidatus Portnoybacteria bacterium CG_4_9_14_3_um_filter_43_11]PJE59574.1 MAG: hypothetical protein COU84_00070 [Candidatus Portnoybacteria bacterium CG10_big_fil_rev_8_21_14_0_10_43_39]
MFNCHSRNLNIFCKPNHNRGLVALNWLIVFSSVGLILFYLIQTNSLVDYSYRIREQKKLISELEEKNHSLEMEIVRRQSPFSLEEAIKPLGLVEMKDAVYLSWEKEVAAIKK